MMSMERDGWRWTMMTFHHFQISGCIHSLLTPCFSSRKNVFLPSSSPGLLQFWHLCGHRESSQGRGHLSFLPISRWICLRDPVASCDGDDTGEETIGNPKPKLQHIVLGKIWEIYSLQACMQQSIATFKTFKILQLHQDPMSLPRLPGSFRADSISFRKSRNEHFVVPSKSWRLVIVGCGISTSIGTVKNQHYLQYIHIYTVYNIYSTRWVTLYINIYYIHILYPRSNDQLN